MIAQLVVEKCTAEDHMTNSSGPPTPQESRYGAVHYNQYYGQTDSYNGQTDSYNGKKNPRLESSYGAVRYWN